MHIKLCTTLWVAFILIFTLTCGAYAQDWYFSPKVELTGKYNNNVLFSEDDRISDFVTSLQPTFVLSRDSELSRMRFETKINAEAYALHPDLNTIENQTQFKWTREWNQRFSTTMNGLFAHEETLNQELEAVGQVTARVERYRYGGGLTSDYALTENIGLQIGCDISETQYPSGLFPDLQVTETHINPTWKMNAWNTLGILASYTIADYMSAFGIVDRTLATSLTWRRELSEKMHFTAGAGVNFDWLEREIPVYRLVLTPNGFAIVTDKSKERSFNQNFIFNATLNRDWTGRFSTEIAAGREHYNSVDTSSVEHTFIRTSSNYKLSELSSFNLDLGYDFDQTKGTTTVDYHYFRIAPSWNRKLNERLSLTLGASYDYALDLKVQQTNRDRLTVWAALTYDWQRMFAKH